MNLDAVNGRWTSRRRDSPDFLSVPWGYLAAVTALVLGAVAAAGTLTLRALRRPAIEELRDL